MKNQNPPVRLCQLSMHWHTREPQREAEYAHAEAMMSAMVKGGMKEPDAKKAVEKLWDLGYSHGEREGYESGYDAGQPSDNY